MVNDVSKVSKSGLDVVEICKLMSEKQLEVISYQNKTGWKVRFKTHMEFNGKSQLKLRFVYVATIK